MRCAAAAAVPQLFLKRPFQAPRFAVEGSTILQSTARFSAVVVSGHFCVGSSSLALSVAFRCGSKRAPAPEPWSTHPASVVSQPPTCVSNITARCALSNSRFLVIAHSSHKATTLASFCQPSVCDSFAAPKIAYIGGHLLVQSVGA